MRGKKRKTNIRKKNAEKIFNTLGIYLMSFLGIFVGIVFIYMSYIEFATISIREVLKNVGQIAITFSLGSLLLEWFGFVNYIRKRMGEILCEDEVIKVLNMERKRQLKSALFKDIYMHNAPNLQMEENNISTIIDNEMDNILMDYYFDEYIIYMDVSTFSDTDGKKYVKKKIRHTFTAKTINRQNCTLDSPINTYLSPPANEDLKALTLNKCSINSVVQDISDWKVSVEDNEKDLKETYSKYYTFNNIIEQEKKKFTFNDRIDIDFEYTTIVSIDDLVYMYQIPKACKHFCMHYNAPEEYKILMEGFGFMSMGNSQRQRLVETQNGAIIRFLDWILPGNGVIVVLQERKKA